MSAFCGDDDFFNVPFFTNYIFLQVIVQVANRRQVDKVNRYRNIEATKKIQSTAYVLFLVLCLPYRCQRDLLVTTSNSL